MFDEGVSVDPKKMEIVVEWSVPNDKTDVRRCLGLATYMRKYIKNFAKITILVTNLLKEKFERINWTRNCHGSFEALKKALTEALVLRTIDPLKGGLVLCTDASDMAIGAIFMQEGKVIAYES